jgi:hypothetical protein
LLVFLQAGNVLDSVPDAALDGHPVLAVKATQFNGKL